MNNNTKAALRFIRQHPELSWSRRMFNQNCDLYNKLAKIANDPNIGNHRRMWANELAHDTLVRGLRQSGNGAYYRRYRHAPPEYRARPGYLAMRRKQDPT